MRLASERGILCAKLHVTRVKAWDAKKPTQADVNEISFSNWSHALLGFLATKKFLVLGILPGQKKESLKHDNFFKMHQAPRRNYFSL